MKCFKEENLGAIQKKSNPFKRSALRFLPEEKPEIVTQRPTSMFQRKVRIKYRNTLLIFQPEKSNQEVN
jgi:hypothetical protein